MWQFICKSYDKIFKFPLIVNEIVRSLVRGFAYLNEIGFEMDLRISNRKNCDSVIFIHVVEPLGASCYV